MTKTSALSVTYQSSGLDIATVQIIEVQDNKDRGGYRHGQSGRPSIPLTKSGAGHGCEKQSALVTEKSYHLNP